MQKQRVKAPRTAACCSSFSTRLQNRTQLGSHSCTQTEGEVDPPINKSKHKHTQPRMKEEKIINTTGKANLILVRPPLTTVCNNGPSSEKGREAEADAC